MDTAKLERVGDFAWRIPPRDGMRVPAVIYGDRGLLENMDDKVREQLCNVATLPGIA